MIKKAIKILKERVEQEFLPFVQKPSRYIGGEVNQIRKELGSCSLTFGLCFPDLYEIAMSNSGIAIIYEILNSISDVAAERIFSPWTDAEEVLREKGIELFSLESKAALSSFDVLGFSLTNELCYTNVLNMLDLGGVEIRSSKRKEREPIVIAGGSMANCCEPMADFIDLFVLGEGEDAVVELAGLIKKEKKRGTKKAEILKKAAESFDWAYVPALYVFEYANDKIKSFRSLDGKFRERFINAAVEDFENSGVHLKPIVPFVQAVHERVSVEVMRGCPGRCRFCQASFCRRPIRFRSVERILEIAKRSYEATGFDTISLLSLSTADYPHLEELIAKLQEYFNDKCVGISVPSLRVDQQLHLLPKLVNSVRKSGLTIAVEAADERLRLLMNKRIHNDDLYAAVEQAYRSGWQQLKLYFMAGLPGETEENLRQIVKLSYELAKLRKNVDGKTGNINAAVSWLVPKPHTPLQWMGQASAEYFHRARSIILEEKKRLNARFINFKFHNIETSLLESAMGRGDRRLGGVVECAWRKGARFDLWSETFNYDLWEEAFAASGLELGLEGQRKFDVEDILPWEHLGGPEKKYLKFHYEQVLGGLD
ncbi:MAG: TIGR03960 family B12-binding radical SAM protein [Phycisphaerae bacterium]|nr:TIGR03960 family B12-binding radical SAM protein [Phycisphaerae bacterium]